MDIFIIVNACSPIEDWLELLRANWAIAGNAQFARRNLVLRNYRRPKFWCAAAPFQ